MERGEGRRQARGHPLGDNVARGGLITTRWPAAVAPGRPGDARRASTRRCRGDPDSRGNAARRYRKQWIERGSISDLRRPGRDRRGTRQPPSRVADLSTRSRFVAVVVPPHRHAARIAARRGVAADRGGGVRQRLFALPGVPGIVWFRSGHGLRGRHGHRRCQDEFRLVGAGSVPVAAARSRHSRGVRTHRTRQCGAWLPGRGNIGRQSRRLRSHGVGARDAALGGAARDRSGGRRAVRRPVLLVPRWRRNRLALPPPLRGFRPRTVRPGRRALLARGSHPLPVRGWGHRGGRGQRSGPQGGGRTPRHVRATARRGRLNARHGGATSRNGGPTLGHRGPIARDRTLSPRCGSLPAGSLIPRRGSHNGRGGKLGSHGRRGACHAGGRSTAAGSALPGAPLPGARLVGPLGAGLVGGFLNGVAWVVVGAPGPPARLRWSEAKAATRAEACPRGSRRLLGSTARWRGRRGSGRGREGRDLLVGVVEPRWSRRGHQAKPLRRLVRCGRLTGLAYVFVRRPSELPRLGGTVDDGGDADGHARNVPWCTARALRPGSRGLPR